MTIKTIISKTILREWECDKAYNSDGSFCLYDPAQSRRIVEWKSDDEETVLIWEWYGPDAMGQKGWHSYTPHKRDEEEMLLTLLRESHEHEEQAT